MNSDMLKRLFVALGIVLLMLVVARIGYGAEIACPSDYAQPGPYAVIEDTITVEGITITRTRPSPMPALAPWVLAYHALNSLTVSVAEQLAVAKGYGAAFLRWTIGDAPSAQCWFDSRPFRAARVRAR